jgi:hypothetical protein
MNKHDQAVEAALGELASLRLSDIAKRALAGSIAAVAAVQTNAPEDEVVKGVLGALHGFADPSIGVDGDRIRPAVQAALTALQLPN